MNFRKLREKAGLRQLDVSEKLGVTRSTVAKWETGETLPRASLLPDIAKIFDCSIDDLLQKDSD